MAIQQLKGLQSLTLFMESICTPLPVGFISALQQLEHLTCLVVLGCLPVEDLSQLPRSLRMLKFQDVGVAADAILPQNEESIAQSVNLSHLTRLETLECLVREGIAASSVFPEGLSKLVVRGVIDAVQGLQQVQGLIVHIGSCLALAAAAACFESAASSACGRVLQACAECYPSSTRRCHTAEDPAASWWFLWVKGPDTAGACSGVGRSAAHKDIVQTYWLRAPRDSAARSAVYCCHATYCTDQIVCADSFMLSKRWGCCCHSCGVPFDRVARAAVAGLRLDAAHFLACSCVLVGVAAA